MSSQNGSITGRKTKEIVSSALWTALLTVTAWVVVASWGHTFWPTVAFFAVCTVGVAIPLGLALGVLIPRKFASGRTREVSSPVLLAESKHSDAVTVRDNDNGGR